MNVNKQWKTRARIPGFKGGHRKFCTAKGDPAEPKACPSKKIARSKKGKRGLYYVFCLAGHGCSCQSIYPKTLKIPMKKSKGGDIVG